MGISPASTSAHSEKPQRQTSPSKSLCVCDRDNEMKTGVRDGAALRAREDSKALPQIETEQEQMRQRAKGPTSA